MNILEDEHVTQFLFAKINSLQYILTISNILRNIERILTFQGNRNWVAVLQRAVNTFNNTKSRSLAGFAPNDIKGDNIAKLQAFILKRRAKKNKPFLNRKPYFSVNQPVRTVVFDKFRQRGYKARWSKEISYISAVLSDAVPQAYRLRGSNRLWYKEELLAVDDEVLSNNSVNEKKILGIISSKKFPVRFLRTGKPISYEIKYLVRLEGKPESVYLTKAEVVDCKNGIESLKQF